MDSFSQPDDQLLLKNLQFAESAATRYQSAHPQLDIDDCRSVANEVAWLFTREKLIVAPRAIEYRLRAMLRAVKREASRFISLERIADCAEGAPLNSMRDLRRARSLNPSADISPKLAEVLADIQASAVKQNCPQHPEHDWYLDQSRCNRDRLAAARPRYEQVKGNLIQFHGRNDDALPLAA